MLFFINLQPTHLKFDICSVTVALRYSVSVALRCILKFSICNEHTQVLLLDELDPLLPGNNVLTMDRLNLCGFGVSNSYESIL
jgi:hypothetical protein